METPNTPNPEVKLGDHVFKFRTNNVRADMLRDSSLMNWGVMYLAEGEFETEVDRAAAKQAVWPFYHDLLSCLVSIDDNPKHPLITKFLENVGEWDKFVAELQEAGYWDELLIAWNTTLQLNPQWYKQPVSSVMKKTHANEVALIDQATAAMDIDNPEKPPMPDQIELVEAVDSLMEAAEEATPKGFLDPKRS